MLAHAPCCLRVLEACQRTGFFKDIQQPPYIAVVLLRCRHRLAQVHHSLSPPLSLPFILFGSWDVALGALNTAFVAIFAVEAGLKVVAFGLKPCVANRFFSRRCPQLLDWPAHRASPSHSSLWLTSSPTRTRIPFYDQ